MLSPCFAARIFVIGAVLLGASATSGQSYPNKPLRVVTSAAGGSIDFVARVIAPGLTDGLGQQIVVDNRGGAGGIIAIDTVAKAPADGYTALIYNNAVWTLPLMMSVPYDPVKDLSPIISTAAAPAILVVHPSLPVQSVKDLIALAKTKPGELNYGGGGAGSQNFLAAELFKSMAGGLKIVNVPFKGGGPAVIALLGAEVQMMFASVPSVTGHIKSGRLRALAVTSAEPSPLLPGMPTIAASGLPGYELVSLYGVFVPRKTPPAIVKRLNQEIARVLSMADVKQKLAAGGMDVIGGSPEQLAVKMRAETSTMSKLFKDAGIRAN
jgi:tripartite-type tricarboxylate transporter receptor subunit TctC